MRLLALLLMIALLPLRGWAGEVMATDMALNQMVRSHLLTESATQSATESGADRARIHWDKITFEGKKPAFLVQNPLFEATHANSAAMPDCEGHAKTDAAPPAHAQCDSCSACQACHTLALSPPTARSNVTFSSRTMPRAAVVLFASAVTALSQKPPIS